MPKSYQANAFSNGLDTNSTSPFKASKVSHLGLSPSLQPPNAATATEQRERRNHRRCRKCECGTWGGWGGIDPSIHPMYP